MTALSRTRPRPHWPLAVAAAGLLAVPACSSDDPAPAAGSAAPAAAATTTAAPSAEPTSAPSSPAETGGGTGGGGETDVCTLLTEAEVRAMVPDAGPGRPEGPGTCTWGTAPDRSVTIRIGSPGSAPGGELPGTSAAPLIQGVRVGGEGRLGEFVVDGRVGSVRFGTGVPAPVAAGFVVATGVRVIERFGA